MAYGPMYETEVRHDGLGKYRHIRGSEKSIVEQKAQYQKLQWDEQWQRKLEADRRTAERERAMHEKGRLREQTASEKARQKEETQRYKDAQKREGIDRDTEAKAAIELLRDTLGNALKINSAIDWNRQKDTTKFQEPPPKLALPPAPENQPSPAEPVPEIVPPKPVLPNHRPSPPEKTDIKYQPVFGFLDRLITSRMARKLTELDALFQQDRGAWVIEVAQFDIHVDSELQRWEDRKKSIEEKYAARHADWLRSVESTKAENSGKKSWWESNCESVRAKHSDAVKEWEQRKEKYYERQKEAHAAIDMNRQNYTSLDHGAITDYCDSVLLNSTYPDYFPKEWDLDYNPDSRILVIEYTLPAPEDIPTLKDVQYVQSKDDFKEYHHSEKESEALYDSLLYQIALRTIHELFEADTVDALDAVAFSGIVTAIDKTTGHSVTACILSLLARKEPFKQINLAGIDPKACFKSLKGIAASRLAGLTSISPIMVIDKDDRRFIPGYGVTDYIDEATNLATMDWEDFEHLIREVFQQEFATGGGEVKVTQASRDGGVDAVAFDPDPIRGGKIVIQAKRYANTVGVSAVRDLYGTVMNEGAIKGLLVTTADYGSDAYEFAKGKPLTLLNGSNLLHLLEKHGHQARINLHEAKQENRQAQLAGIPRKRNLLHDQLDCIAGG